MKDFEKQIIDHLYPIEIPQSIQGWVFQQIRKENEEEIYHFACEVHKAFNKGGPEVKRTFFTRLGSNLLLKDEELLLEVKIPF